MIKMKKLFFSKYYSPNSLNISKYRLLHPSNIKYWKTKRKNTKLRLKSFAKNDFLVNGIQILT